MRRAVERTHALTLQIGTWLSASASGWGLLVLPITLALLLSLFLSGVDVGSPRPR